MAMFLNYIKNFLTKKAVKKELVNFKLSYEDSKIKTVGVVIDAIDTNILNDILLDLIQKGIEKQAISVLIYKTNAKEEMEYPSFCFKDLSWSGTINKVEVNEFVNQKFDLLINYYDTEKAPLLLISYRSKASFKVGFSSIDKRLNHFMISTETKDYLVFLNELFKYLKILKKI